MKVLNFFLVLILLTTYSCKDDKCTHCPEFEVWKNGACECERGAVDTDPSENRNCRFLAHNQWFIGENDCGCVENVLLSFGKLYEGIFGTRTEIEVFIDGSYLDGSVYFLKSYDSVNLQVPMSYMPNKGCSDTYQGLEMEALLSKDRRKADVKFKFYNKSWPSYEGLKVEKECSFVLEK